jgi:hypothetical protein
MMHSRQQERVPERTSTGVHMKQLDRSSLGILLIAMGVAALGVVFVLLHLVSPSDGARLEPGQAVWKTGGVLLTPLQEGSSTLHPNDLLIAIDGTRIERLASNLLCQRSPIQILAGHLAGK